MNFSAAKCADFVWTPSWTLVQIIQSTSSVNVQ